MAISIPNAVNLHTLSVNSDTQATNFGTLETSGNGSIGAAKGGGNLPINTSATQLGLDSSNQGGIRWNNAVFNSNTDHKIYVGGFQFNAPNRMGVDSIINKGIVSRVYSGTSATSNYVEFNIGGNDTLSGRSQQGVNLFAIDPLALGGSQIGSFNSSSVEGWGVGFKSSLSGSASSNPRVWAFFCRTYLFSTEKNNADIPTFTGVSDFGDLVNAIQGTGNYNTKIHELAKSGTVYSIVCPFQIGDNGATLTSFNDNGITIQTAAHNEPSNPLSQLSDKSMRVYASLGASDSVVLSGVYIWGVQSDWDLNSSVGASVNISGTLSGIGNLTIGSDVTFSGIFTNSKTLINNNANVSGLSIANSEGMQVDSMPLQSFSISNSTKGLIINSAGTYDISNYNFNGNTFDVTINDSVGIVTIVTRGVSVSIDQGTGNTLTIDDSVNVNISCPNIINDSRVQYYNQTKQSEISNGVVSGGLGFTTQVDLSSASIDVGDFIRLRATYQSGLTAKKELEAIGVMTSLGLSFINTQEDDDIYISNGLNGANITKFTPDFLSNEIDISLNSDFQSKELYAWFKYTETTQQGISDFFGGLNAIDEGNYEIKSSIYIDNTTSTNIIQTDSARIFRTDGNYPVINPTTGGGGVNVNWKNNVLTTQTNVSGLTASESVKLMSLDTTNLDATISSRSTFNADTEVVTTDFESREASKADVSDLPTLESNQNIINEGIEKASLFIPHKTNLP